MIRLICWAASDVVASGGTRPGCGTSPGSWTRRCPFRPEVGTRDPQVAQGTRTPPHRCARGTGDAPSERSSKLANTAERLAGCAISAIPEPSS